MKKFLTSVFMLSMVLLSMSVFDSCKDYDEDEYNDLLIQIDRNDANLRALIKADSTFLKGLIDKLQAAQDSCKNNCRIRMNILHDSIVVNETQIKINKDSIWILAQQVADLQSTDAGLQAQIDTLKGLQAQIDSLNALLSDSTGAITNVVTILGKIGEINSTIGNLGAALKALQDNVYTKPQVESLLDFYTKNADFVLLQSKVNDVAKDASEALERAKNDSVWIKALETTVADVSKVANEALERAKNDSIWIKTLETTVTGLTTKVESLADVTDQLDAAIKLAEKNRISADSLLQNQIDAIVVGMSDLDDKVNNILEVKIPEMEQAYKDADQKLQDSIDALDQEVKQNAADIATINGQITDITGRLDKVETTLANLITGIVIQSTKNPVFGSFALPLNVNSNVLMAFYGKALNNVGFPSPYPGDGLRGNYVKNSQILTEKDLEMIGTVAGYKDYNAGEDLFNEGYGNAGTIYVTVNPGSVDFSNEKLELVNSKDEACKITLSPLKKENDVELMFGYTRAAETNGFYSATARLNKEDIDAVKVHIEKGLKSDFEAVLKDRSFLSVGNLAATLYSQFNNVLPAQGLKATWKDGDNNPHSVYSQYGIAATAIRPLSYAFLEDLDVVTVPGYERVISLIDRTATKIKNRIKDAWPNLVEPYDIKVKEYVLDKFDNTKYSVKFSMSILTDGVNSRAFKEQVGSLEYVVVQNKISGTWTTVMKLALSDDDATAEQSTTNPLRWDLTIKKSLGDIDDLYDAADYVSGRIEDLIADANNMLSEADRSLASINNSVDDAKAEAKSYIDRLNSRLTSLINSANERIQPVLLVGNRATGVVSASRTIGHVSQLNAATVELIMTSYTAEIVTPAFKKHIAVTNVFNGDKSAQDGDADCKAALDKVNKQGKMNTVINGDWCAINATFQPNYVYEIAYSALDYSGKISTHKYYVQYQY